MDKEKRVKITGFSLVELLIVLTMVAILAALALPNFQSYLQKNILRGAVETYVAHLKYAQTEAMKNTNTVFVSIVPGADWCYGLSNIDGCNCALANQCLLNGVTTQFDNTDYPNVSVALSNFTQVNGQETLSFEPIKGSASHTGTLTFTLGSRSVSISTTRLGVVAVCSSQLSEYPSC